MIVQYGLLFSFESLVLLKKSLLVLHDSFVVLKQLLMVFDDLRILFFLIVQFDLRALFFLLQVLNLLIHALLYSCSLSLLSVQFVSKLLQIIFQLL